MVTRTLSGSLRCLGVAFSVLCLLGSLARAQDNSEFEKRYAEEEKKYGPLRVKVKDASGKDTTVFEKMVVTSPKATIAPEPGKDPKRTSDWSVFYRIKDENGSDKPVDGWVRVGSSSGKPLGWIKEEHLTPWRTRFLLEIQNPDGNSTFTVKTDNGVLKLAKNMPEGYTRLALVTRPPTKEDVDNPDNDEYPVTVYTGKLNDKMGGNNLLNEVKLEIVFVIESTDFMQRKYGNRPLFDYLKDLMKECVNDLQQQKDLKGAVRLGLVEYRDNVKLAEYPFRMATKLTDDPKAFTDQVTALRSVTMNDDWMDDVISGIDMALGSEAGWTENSVKHVILIGASSCQLKKQGQQDPYWKQMGGIENKMSKKSPQELGFNKSGLSIDDLLARAAPVGGADDVKHRRARTIHTVQLGRPEDFHPQHVALWPGLPDAVKKYADIANKIQDMSDAEIEAKEAELGKEFGDPVKGTLAMIYLMRKRTGLYQEKLAREQYTMLATKNSDYKGLNMEVEPSIGGVTTASTKLSTSLKESFQALKTLREGGTLESASKTELIAPLWKLELAQGGKVKDLPPRIDGLARVRGEGDKKVAQRKIMVTEIELRRLKSTLEALNKKFAGMAAPAARKNVADVLKELKTALALTSIGQQELDAGTDLQALITDLPLRTGALKVSARSLALMSQDGFLNWLARLEAAQNRIQVLLDRQNEFSFTSQEAVNDKIAYLPLTALP